MLICPNCGKELAEGTAFCDNCGTAIPAAPAAETVFCANCGTQTDASSEFCQNCGAAVTPHRACLKCGTYKGQSVVDAAE